MHLAGRGRSKRFLLLRYAFERAEIITDLRAVADGEEAMDYLSGVDRFRDRKLYPLPFLVLVDFEMPKVNGLELLQWIRSQPGLRRLAVILFTTSRARHHVDLAYDLGVNSFVVKPRDVKGRIDFALALKAWWLTVNEFASIKDTHAALGQSSDEDLRAGGRSKARS